MAVGKRPSCRSKAVHVNSLGAAIWCRSQVARVARGGHKVSGRHHGACVVLTPYVCERQVFTGSHQATERANPGEIVLYIRPSSEWNAPKELARAGHPMPAGAKRLVVLH